MDYSFLDLAYDVLKESPKPLIYQEIWELAKQKGITNKLESEGKTPWQSLGARLYIEVRDKENSKFISVGNRPMRFFLKERQGEIPPEFKILEKEYPHKDKHEYGKFEEKDLHPLLVYFLYSNPSFNKGVPIYSKTISHEKSKKTGISEWTHPDIVGFSLPVWNKEVVELNRLSDNNSLRMFSFELKKSLNRGNYRESYFQAVSNSSWAHQGYLVASDILQDDEFLAEMERLASSFGIGIIFLNPKDIDSSAILYPARSRENLDWETINKLCENNSDFKFFLENVKIDCDSKKIHKSEYDKVLENINKYIKDKKIV